MDSLVVIKHTKLSQFGDFLAILLHYYGALCEICYAIVGKNGALFRGG
jgi:hypothetical protein